MKIAAGTPQNLLAQLQQKGSWVHVAAHGYRRRQGAKPLEHFRLAHITRVDDQLRAAQRLDRLGTKQAMRVGDDTNSHPETSSTSSTSNTP